MATRKTQNLPDGIDIRLTTHNAVFGLLVENCLVALLRTYLPRKYRKMVDLSIEPEVVTGIKVDDSRHSLRSLHCDALLKVALKSRFKPPEGEGPDFVSAGDVSPSEAGRP